MAPNQVHSSCRATLRFVYRVHDAEVDLDVAVLDVSSFANFPLPYDCSISQFSVLHKHDMHVSKFYSELTSAFRKTTSSCSLSHTFLLLANFVRYFQIL